MAKKEPKKGGFKEKFQQAFGKMKADRSKEREEARKDCPKGKCGCGK